MTNEIKEILDDLDYCKNLRAGNILLKYNECDELLDYITNLQNEIFDLKDTIQNKNDCIGAYECIIEDRDKRIDKAVEYNKEIKNKIEKQLDNGQSYDFIVAGYLAIFHDTLEEILRGDE